MMNYAVFSDDMITVLKELIGKTFKSYECNKSGVDVVYGKVRLNLGTFSVDLYNYTKPIPFYGELEEEDISCFSCELADKNVDFRPCEKDQTAHLYMIDERINGVEIIRDKIFVGNNEYEITMDQALILRSRYNVYSFYRDWFFGETIRIGVDRREETVLSVDDVKKQWNCDEGTVEVGREIIRL
ncbi:MAG: hypothetical protein K5655_06110 [Lachnospiraceae bacterium]|nr:hypothetical protein [Lachnospiraceae bacterium]